MITKSTGEVICNINTRCELEYLFAVIDVLKIADPKPIDDTAPASLTIKLTHSDTIQLQMGVYDEHTGERHILHRDITVTNINKYSEVLSTIKHILDRNFLGPLLEADFVAWAKLYKQAVEQVHLEVLTHLKKFE